MPLSWHVKLLVKEGVKAVVNTCDEYSGPVEEYEVHGIKQLHIPTVDHFEPTLADTIKAIDFIDKHAEKGEGVYIHCKSGVGRSGNIAFCWLLKKRRESLEETNSYIQTRRRVKRNLHKRKICKEYFNRLNNIVEEEVVGEGEGETVPLLGRKGD
jgi:atypical dual specificity phosphatase